MSYLRKAIALFQLNSSHVDRAVLTGVTGPTLHNLLLETLFYPQRRRKQSQSIEGSFFASWPIRSFFCVLAVLFAKAFFAVIPPRMIVLILLNEGTQDKHWCRQSLRWLLRFAEELRRQMAQFWRLYRIWQSADRGLVMVISEPTLLKKNLQVKV